MVAESSQRVTQELPENPFDLEGDEEPSPATRQIEHETPQTETARFETPPKTTTGSSDKLVEELLRHMQARLFKRFSMTDGGVLTHVLGCQIDYDRDAGTLSLHQTRYIMDMLETFDPGSTRTEKTPMPEANCGECT